MTISYKSFDKTVENRRLMDSWGDGLFVVTEEDKKLRADKLYAEAKGNFTNIMKSLKNNNSIAYETWAVNKALGLSAKASSSMKTSKL
jgi:predicted nucleic-acid-binding protein